MTRVLVVDLGGVAARYQPQRRLAALADRTGIDPAVLDAAIFGSGLDRQAELGELTRRELIDRLLEITEHRIDARTLVDAWSLAFEPVDALLDLVANSPVRSVLFTNNGPILDACLEGPLARIRDAFQLVVCSWHIRACKPDRVAFESLAARLEAQPTDLVLFDDSHANVEAARACGWSAHQVESEPAALAAIQASSSRARNRSTTSESTPASER